MDTGVDAQGVSFNRELALERIGNDLKLLQLVVGAFLEDVASMVSELREAVEKNCPTLIEHAAHRLKGSLLTVAAERAAAMARALERLGHAGSTVGAQMLFGGLKEELEVALPQLRELVEHA